MLRSASHALAAHSVTLIQRAKQFRNHVLHRDALDRARLRVAGVVDQHADGAVLVLDGPDGGLHRRLVGHVERQCPAALRGQIFDRSGAARGRVDLPALGHQLLGGRAPDA